MISRQKMEATPADLVGALLGTGGDFRAALADRLETDRVWLFPSGRAAIAYLLRALPQRRVIVPAYTCSVVVEAIHRAECEPTFVDVDLDTFNMTADAVAKVAAPETVVLATHQFGVPCVIDAIAEIARAAGAPLLEDAAGAFGSRWNGRPVGSWGSATLASFESTKTITLARGGVVTVSDPDLAESLDEELERVPLATPGIGRSVADLLRVAADGPATSRTLYPWVRRWRTRGDRFTADDGSDPDSPEACYGARLGRWQERLGARLLGRFDAIAARRHAIASRYREALEDVESLALQRVPPGADPVPIRFPIRVLDGDKLDFYRAVVAEGVDLSFSFSYSVAPPGFPNAETLARQVLDLPIYSRLGDRAVDRVIAAVRRAAGG